MMKTAFTTALATGLSAILFAPDPAAAQSNFPNKPIRLVMPLPAGSGLDVVARLVTEPFSANLGQTVIVENRPGGGGIIAAQAVASAPADGYTLLGGAASVFTILPAQKEKLPIDVNKDLVQVGILATVSLYVAVSPSLNVNTFSEFVALAKAKPGTINVGTNGAGTLPHFTGIMLARKLNMPITVVPYNTGGTIEAVRDMIGGRVQATLEGYGTLKGFVDSKDIKLIAVMGAEREPPINDLPTVAETNPGITSIGFMTLAAPANTPPDVVERLNKGLAVALDTPIVRQRMVELGMAPKIWTPAQTKKFIEDQQQLWWPIVREASN